VSLRVWPGSHRKLPRVTVSTRASPSKTVDAAGRVVQLPLAVMSPGRIDDTRALKVATTRVGGVLPCASWLMRTLATEGPGVTGGVGVTGLVGVSGAVGGSASLPPPQAVSNDAVTSPAMAKLCRAHLVHAFSIVGPY
jgi:hypothetical protein